jgi:hypothetical protein
VTVRKSKVYMDPYPSSKRESLLDSKAKRSGVALTLGLGLFVALSFVFPLMWSILGTLLCAAGLAGVVLGIVAVANWCGTGRWDKPW